MTQRCMAFHCADYPRSNLSTAALALSAKISFKSQIYRLSVDSNDTVGNMTLHKLLFHHAFNSYIFVENGMYNCYKSNKKKVSQFFK